MAFRQGYFICFGKDKVSDTSFLFSIFRFYPMDSLYGTFILSMCKGHLGDLFIKMQISGDQAPQFDLVVLVCSPGILTFRPALRNILYMRSRRVSGDV